MSPNLDSRTDEHHQFSWAGGGTPGHLRGQWWKRTSLEAALGEWGDRKKEVMENVLKFVFELCSIGLQSYSFPTHQGFEKPSCRFCVSIRGFGAFCPGCCSQLENQWFGSVAVSCAISTHTVLSWAPQMTPKEEDLGRHISKGLRVQWEADRPTVCGATWSADDGTEPADGRVGGDSSGMMNSEWVHQKRLSGESWGAGFGGRKSPEVLLLLEKLPLSTWRQLRAGSNVPSTPSDLQT